MRGVLLLAVTTLILFAPPTFADFSGSVVGVTDGDTITVLHHGTAEKIRLNGIDCPEKGQAYGQKAKQAASGLAFGKEVTLQTHGKDKYGRTIGDVLLPDGTNVNHELVKEGWCWWYRKYTPLETELEALEKSAGEAKKGLWVDLQLVRRGRAGKGRWKQPGVGGCPTPLHCRTTFPLATRPLGPPL